MGVVNLARVDERLIHGQVMVTLSQKSGVNSIFVVDEVVAKDKFMRDLYKNAGRGVRMFFWTFFSNYIPVSSDIEEDLVLLKIT